MTVRVLSITQKMPKWITLGCDEYLKRIPKPYKPEFIELPLMKRSSKTKDAVINAEGETIIAALKPDDYVVALVIDGQRLSSKHFAEHMSLWQSRSQQIVFIIGGPDGLSEHVLKQARFKLSLSDLTFPHFLVRLLLAEQFYRAYSINHHHPYHK